MPVDDKSQVRRGSKAKGKGDGKDDDDAWMYENQSEDAVWKKMQQNTFTRWVVRTGINKFLALLIKLN